MATDYTPGFFDIVRDGAQQSAAVIVPMVMEHLAHLAPKTVVDVGCGEGWFGHEFQNAGCEVLGIDGDYATPAIPMRAADLEQPLPVVGTFDLAVCLEVAEHLSPARADSFIADLCDLAPIVLFSAAIPGQGGAHHVNEQWPQYWDDLFGKHGHWCTGALRWKIWTDGRVENWYRQNLLVAAAKPETLPALFDTPLAPVFPVVHPVLYDARR